MNRKHLLGSVLVAALCSGFLVTPQASADVIIDTSGSISPPSCACDYAAGWGTGTATPTYGQVVTAPSGTNSLSNFSFFLFDNASPVNYAAYVYQWSGSGVAGSALYRSAISTSPATNTLLYVPVSFSPAIAVNPGTSYVLFLSTLGIAGPSPGGTHFPTTPLTAYPDGLFVLSNQPDFVDLTTHAWDTGTEENLGFTADFATVRAVPEPSPLVLLCLPLLALVGIRRAVK